MDMVTQRIEQNNEQNGVLDAYKEIFEQENIETLDLQSNTVLKDCMCGAVGCAAEVRTPEERMAHRPAGLEDQVARAASSPATESVRLGMLLLGRGRSKYNDYPVALRIVPSNGGNQTLAKLGLSLPGTVTVEHEVYGVRCVDHLFKVPGFDQRLQETLSDRAIGARKVIPLGPGAVLMTRSESFVPNHGGSSPLVNYVEGKSISQVPLSVLPEEVLDADPVPLDEDPYSSGGLQRIYVKPEESRPSKALFDPLVMERGVHSFTAREKEGKSMSTLFIACGLIEAGKTVAYFDADANGGRINERLFSMGASVDDLNAHFRYYRADGLDVARFETVMRVDKPDLVIFDNLTNLLSRAGINENDNTAVTRWFNDYADKVRQMGAAALILDHPSKNASSRYARGGGSKLAEEDIAWTIKKIEDFNKKKVGKVKFTLVTANDGEEKPASVLYRIGGTPFVFEREGAAKLTEPEQEALEALEDGMSHAEWRKAMQGTSERFAHPQNRKRAKDGLIEKGRVVEDEDKFYASE